MPNPRVGGKIRKKFNSVKSLLIKNVLSWGGGRDEDTVLLNILS
jgi:hypothetical protein